MCNFTSSNFFFTIIPLKYLFSLPIFLHYEFFVYVTFIGKTYFLKREFVLCFIPMYMFSFIHIFIENVPTLIWLGRWILYFTYILYVRSYIFTWSYYFFMRIVTQLLKRFYQITAYVKFICMHSYVHMNIYSYLYMYVYICL